MSFDKSIQVSASALRAESVRMRVIAENLANAQSVAREPGGTPYRRKIVAFSAALDPASGATTVKVDGIGSDRSDFQKVYQPGSPAADAAGYVLMPNVNMLLETADMKAAQRSYEANLNAITAARTLTMRTIDLLK